MHSCVRNVCDAGVCRVDAAYGASLCDERMFVDAVDVDAVVAVSVCV